MSKIKTWTERCKTHPDHEDGMATHSMIKARMQEEIDELRLELTKARRFRKDAERYRWLRKASKVQCFREVFRGPVEPELEHVSGKKLDATIDACMTKAKK